MIFICLKLYIYHSLVLDPFWLLESVGLSIVSILHKRDIFSCTPSWKWSATCSVMLTELLNSLVFNIDGLSYQIPWNLPMEVILRSTLIVLWQQSTTELSKLSSKVLKHVGILKEWKEIDTLIDYYLKVSGFWVNIAITLPLPWSYSWVASWLVDRKSVV